MKSQSLRLTIEKILSHFVLFLIVVKIIFGLTTVGDILIKHFFKKTEKNDLLDQQFVHWKQLTEFIFVISMSFLLIFIFSPWFSNQIYITREMSILFYLFGYIMLFTANWSVVIKEPEWFKRIKMSLKFNS